MIEHFKRLMTLEKRNALNFIYLFIFIGLVVYLRFKALHAPIYQFHLDWDLNGILKYGFIDIFFSDYHRLIQIYRNAFSNLLFHYFGINVFTFRAFPVAVSFLTMFFVYRFISQKIGRHEAVIGLFLFGMSHYSIFTTVSPYYGDFYMFGSFMTFSFLYKGLHEDKLFNWICFGIWNFLNVTNVLLAGLFIPEVLLIAVFILWLQTSEAGFLTEEVKKKVKHFVVAFLLSIGAILLMYGFRGINLIEQVFNVIFLNKDYGGISNDITFTHVPSILSTFLRLFDQVYLQINFLYFDGGRAQGTPFAHWSYFCFFVLGLWVLYHRNKEIFGCFIILFSTPTILFVFFLKIAVGRYMAFVLPFYLTAVACGFIHLFNLLTKKISSSLLKDGSLYLAVFVFFSWIIQPGFLFKETIIDKQYLTRGIREFRDYLREHLKENDIIINVTSFSELRAEVGDALNLVNYDFYLREFAAKHSLELLPLRNGKVGVWLILRKPLDDDKLVPFYFPGTYSPRVVMKVHGLYLYYGEMEIPKTTKVSEDNQFTTPFWSLVKGSILHSHKKLEMAKSYYQVAVKYGFNLDRIYFHLALANLNNLDVALNYLEKGIEIIETPTILTDGSQVTDWNTYGYNKKGLPDSSNKLPQLRYTFAKKNGVKYKKWFMEDFKKSRKYYFSVFYTHAIAVSRSLYFNTGNIIYLKKMRQFVEKGSEYITDPYMIDMAYLTNENKKIELEPKLFNINGIFEMYPPISLN